jgi:hypothetical protein
VGPSKNKNGLFGACSRDVRTVLRIGQGIFCANLTKETGTSGLNFLLECPLFLGPEFVALFDKREGFVFHGQFIHKPCRAEPARRAEPHCFS